MARVELSAWISSARVRRRAPGCLADGWAGGCGECKWPSFSCMLAGGTAVLQLSSHQCARLHAR
eukprot:363737-Chlamydomonas_euryale.AAC.8